jgi:PKD repeat protein
MRINYLIARFLTLFFFGALLGAGSAFATVTCQVVADDGPLTRTTGTDEENIVNGLYSGLAQRYNGINGNITSVRFWARVPLSVGVNNIAKVTIYAVNVSTGLPGTTLGQTTDTIYPSNTLLQVDAVFASVSSDIIISVEPFTPLTDDIWIQHNASLDGDDLKLNLVRQGTTWFKDLDNGDPAWDYDFLILPIATETVTAAFSQVAAGLSVTFTNTSTGASSYRWNFGDNVTSGLAAPAHTYANAGAYTVSLVAVSSDSTCYDSTAQQITVTPSAVNPVRPASTPFFRYDAAGSKLIFEPSADMQVSLFNILGVQLMSVPLNKGVRKEVRISQFADGVYFITTGKAAYKFYKN